MQDKHGSGGRGRCSIIGLGGVAMRLLIEQLVLLVLCVLGMVIIGCASSLTI